MSQPAPAVFSCSRLAVEDLASKWKRSMIALGVSTALYVVAALLFFSLPVILSLSTSDSDSGVDSSMWGIASLWQLAGVLMLIACGANAYTIVMTAKSRKIYAAMGEFQVTVSPDGITYSSQLGTFSTPWSGVTKAVLRARMNAVEVRAVYWAGPVQRLIVPFYGAETRPKQLMQAIAHFSQGRVRQLPDPAKLR